MLDWSDLIARRNEWIAHNFPHPSIPNPGESMLGVIEETGELAHADLKERQAIRGTAEQHQKDAKDALGDITVYLLGVMDHCLVEPAPLTGGGRKDRDTYTVLLEIAEAVGSLATGVQGGGVRSWIEDDVSQIVKGLHRYAATRGWSYEDIVMETWEAVERRDWIAHPDTGLPSGDGDDPQSAVDAPDMTETVPTGGSPSTGQNLHGKSITGHNEQSLDMLPDVD